MCKMFLIVKNCLRPESAHLPIFTRKPRRRYSHGNLELLSRNLQTMLKLVQKPLIICRNSRPEVFCKKVGLKNFEKFTGKH